MNLSLDNLPDTVKSLSVSCLLQQVDLDEERIVLDTLTRLWPSGIAVRVLEGDVLNDDQVVRLVATLVQELFAAIANHHPIDVVVSHSVSVRDIPHDTPRCARCGNFVVCSDGKMQACSSCGGTPVLRVVRGERGRSDADQG